MQIDVGFDFRVDSNGLDPDFASPTLRKYQQLLWSKPLPSGAVFALDASASQYLSHKSHLGEFSLASDSISNSLRTHKRRADLLASIPAEDLDHFQKVGSTIGARLIFPGNRVDKMPTLNVARGFNAKIGDRIDLTLECIRLHYLGESSPLGEAIARYSDFFALFVDFNSYVDFFLLQDFAGSRGVNFILPFDGTFGAPLPNTVEQYMTYMQNSISMVEARNSRIADWAASQ